MNFSKRALLAKVEATYGTDAAPTGAANAILVADNLDVKPMVNDMVERDVLQPYFGHAQQIPVDTMMQATCSVELVSSGALGTAPGWGALLKGCGFSETVSAGVSVMYAPISSGLSSLTLYYNVDGLLHKLLGCRGSVKVRMTPKAIPYLDFNFTGLYGGVTDVALPALTLTAFQLPQAVNNANTSAFTLQGYAGKLYDLNFDVANQLVYRNLVGAEDVQIVDRAPVGNAEIECPTIAAKDYYTAAKNATTGALSITHGTVAGFKVKLDAPNVQVTNPEPANRDKVLSLKLGLRLVPGLSAGNDELTLTCL